MIGMVTVTVVSFVPMRVLVAVSAGGLDAAPS
jgi:hypothetical protein